MDFSKPVCEILHEKAIEFFGKDRVTKAGACVCLNMAVYDPFPEFVSFLSDFTNDNEYLNYVITRDHPLGLCANIRYNTIVVAQLLQY